MLINLDTKILDMIDLVKFDVLVIWYCKINDTTLMSTAVPVKKHRVRFRAVDRKPVDIKPFTDAVQFSLQQFIDFINV